MPVLNHVMFGCSTSQKHKIVICEVLAEDDEYSEEWRNIIIGVFTRDGVRERLGKWARADFVISRFRVLSQHSI